MNHVKTILHMSIWDKSKQTLYCSPNIYITFLFLQFISVQTSLDFSIIKFDQNVAYELRKKFFLKRNPDNGSDFNERWLMLTRNTLHLTTISQGGQWWIFTEPPGSNGSIHLQPWTLYTQTKILCHKRRFKLFHSFNDLNIFGCKSCASCSEMNSKGYSDFKQPIRVHLQGYPLY